MEKIIVKSYKAQKMAQHNVNHILAAYGQATAMPFSLGLQEKGPAVTFKEFMGQDTESVPKQET